MTLKGPLAIRVISDDAPGLGPCVLGLGPLPTAESAGDPDPSAALGACTVVGL